MSEGGKYINMDETEKTKEKKTQLYTSVFKQVSTCWNSFNSFSSFFLRLFDILMPLYEVLLIQSVIQVWMQCLNVFLVFFVTLTIFPAIMAEVKVYSANGVYDFFIPG